MRCSRFSGGSAGGVLLGVGLAAVQILPFIENLDQLGLENRDFDGRHLPFALLVTTVAPNAVGLSINGSEPRWYGPVNAIEAVSFIGAVAVVLAVAALVLRVPRGAAAERSPRWFLAAAAALAATAIYVGGPVLAALQYLPFYSTDFIGRASLVSASSSAPWPGSAWSECCVGSSSAENPLRRNVATGASREAARRRSADCCFRLSCSSASACSGSPWSGPHGTTRPQLGRQLTSRAPWSYPPCS